MKKNRVAAFFVLFLLLAGIGQIAAMPPFEGIDEEGHYSSIRQLADTGQMPLSGKAFIDRNILEYRARGPVYYASRAPYEANGGLTYPAFFARRDLVESYASRYRASGENPAFAPSETPNWQAQHPPLYYLLMTPVAKATSSLSFWTQLFVLRLVSYLIALAGWALGLWGTLRFMKTHMERSPIFLCPEEPDAFPNVMAACGPAAQSRVGTAFFLFPVLFPQFIPEFARLGNDSLCLLIMGGVWTVLLSWLGDEENPKKTLSLGLLLAAGLLTKALFLPIVAGIAGLVCSRMRGDRERFASRLDSATLLFLPSLFACFWYVYKWKFTGSFVGHAEYILLDAKGGIWPNLPDSAHWKDYLLGLYGILLTFLWAGTASLARAYHVFYLPFVGFVFWIFVRYLLSLRRSAMQSLSWIPLWIFVPFLAGLFHHLLSLMALEGYGGTPGWYLHILLPPLAFAFSRALEGVWDGGHGRKSLLFLTSYAFFFMAFSFWAQMPLFAGFAGEGAYKIFSFSAFPFDLVHFPAIMSRLEVLSWPWLGLVCQAAGLLFLMAGLVSLGHSFKEKRPRG